MSSLKKRMLFVLEGNTDIRFVKGLSEYFDLSIIGPSSHLNKKNGLKDRLKDLDLNIPLYEISGGRILYQVRSFFKLISLAKRFDFLFSQENLRGTLSAGLASQLTGIPLFSHSGMPPIEYYRCRYRRGQISGFRFFIGDSIIRLLLRLNSLLCNYWFVLGPFLYEVFSPYKKEIGLAHYYGVDTQLYRPVDHIKKGEIRKELGLEEEKFVIFFSSRVSHEKDPETVLKAVSEIYHSSNPHILLMNLSGGHEQMRELARELGLKNDEKWLITKPPAHPMKDLPHFYQVSDLVIQSSLEEGLGLSPLEALACKVPVIATDVGGMKAHLHPYAKMVPVSDVDAMISAIIQTYEDDFGRENNEKNDFLERGRDYVVKEWDRQKAFKDLSDKINKLLL